MEDASVDTSIVVSVLKHPVLSIIGRITYLLTLVTALRNFVIMSNVESPYLDSAMPRCAEFLNAHLAGLSVQRT